MPFWKKQQDDAVEPRVPTAADWKKRQEDAFEQPVPPSVARSQPKPVTPPPAPKSSNRTWRVKQDDPSADFPTITEAIQAAAPYDTIRIAQGRYFENLTIGKPLHFIGDPVEEEGDFPIVNIILSPDATINWDQSDGSFSNILFSLLLGDVNEHGYRDTSERILIHATGGSLSITDCRFDGTAGSTIMVDGDSSVTIRGTTFSRDGFNNILADNRGQLHIEDCTFTPRILDDWGDENHGGIRIIGECELRLVHCNGESPVYLRNQNSLIKHCTLNHVTTEGGTCTIEDSSIQVFSAISETSKVHISRCQFASYKEASLTSMMGASVYVNNSSIVPGFVAMIQGSLSIQDSIVIQSPTQRLLLVEDGSSLTCRDVTFAVSPAESLILDPKSTAIIDGRPMAPNYHLNK